MRKSILWILFLIFALVFCIPSAFGLRGLFKHIENTKIVSNGVETEAIIIKNSANSNVTINHKKYYSIEYYFYDREGNKHFDKTSISFTSEEINKLESDGFITIKYNNKTFESIEASYSFSLSNGLDVILFFIFGAIGLVFCIILAIIIIKRMKDKNVYSNGAEILATFVNSNSNLKINDKPMFYISYCWYSATGEYKEGKSKSVYTEREAKLFEEAKKFKIKAMGDMSVILSTPEQLKAQLYPNQHRIKDFEQECRYCGSTYNKELNKCPKCGASKFD